MILLPKEKIRKLQAGGGIDRYQTAAGSQFTPVDYAMPGFLSLYKPLNPQTRGVGRHGGGRRGSGSKEDRLKAKGFSNDIEYAFNARDEISNKMSERAQDESYMNSPEYTNDYRELQEANRNISMLEAIQKDFTNSMKGKSVEGGSYAIHNDKALVYDSAENGYKIVALQDAMGAKTEDGRKRYNIETISTAQNLRSRDSSFHGFTDNGKFLQEMILNSYNSEDLYDSVDDAFNSAGITSDIESSLALSDGTKIDADDFYRYIASGLNMKAQIMTETTTNERQLRKGVDNMMDRVTANPGTMSAYRNYAIGRMLTDGVDPTSLSKGQFDQTVNFYVQNDLLSRMKVFVEEKFGKKFKESTKKHTAAGAGPDAEKITMHTNATILSQAAPTGFFQAEHESLFKGKTTSLGITSSAIDNATTFIDEGFVGRDDAPAHNFLDKNRNIKSLIDGSLRTSLSIFNGTSLADLNGGTGIQSAVIPNDTSLEVLQMVPVVKDPNTGNVSVDIRYLQFMDLYKKVLDEVIKNANIPKSAAGNEQAKIYKTQVKEKLMAEDSKFASFIHDIEAGQIVFRNMVAFDVLIPEDMSNLGIDTTDREKFGVYLQEVDDADYISLSGEDVREKFSSGWFGVDEAYRIKVFAPVKPVGRQEMSQFKGVEKFAMKEAEYRRWLEGIGDEERSYTQYRRLEDLPL